MVKVPHVYASDKDTISDSESERSKPTVFIREPQALKRIFDPRKSVWGRDALSTKDAKSVDTAIYRRRHIQIMVMMTFLFLIIAAAAITAAVLATQARQKDLPPDWSPYTNTSSGTQSEVVKYLTYAPSSTPVPG